MNVANSFALNILPKMLLKRTRQKGNQTACSLYRTHWCKILVSRPLEKYCYQTRWVKNTVQINSSLQKNTCWHEISPKYVWIFLLKNTSFFIGRSDDLCSTCKWEESYSFESSEDSFFLPQGLDDCILSICPKTTTEKPILSSLYLALSKLFRFRVEEESATQSESVPFLFEEGGKAPTHKWMSTHVNMQGLVSNQWHDLVQEIILTQDTFVSPHQGCSAA